MFYQILIAISVVGLGWIFWRRWVLSRRSMLFEDELRKIEQRSSQPGEEDKPGDNPIHETIVDLRAQRQADKWANEEKTRKIREAKKAYRKADIYFTKGDYEEAEKYLLQALSYDNDHLDANLKLGLLYLHQENLGRAEFFFQKLIDLKEHPSHYTHLALTLYQQNRLLEAAQSYEKAIELDPKDPRRYLSLAKVYQEQGEMERSLRTIEEASRLDPRNLECLWILVDYYERLARREPLIGTLKRILNLDPYNAQAKEKWEGMVETESLDQTTSEPLKGD